MAAKRQTAKNIAAPRPARLETRTRSKELELACALVALEVPDCDCKQGRLCLRELDSACGRQSSRVCPGKDRCRECPPAITLDRPCPHLAPLLEKYRRHEPEDLETVAESWAVLQRAFDLEGYADRPVPPAESATSREARVSLYAKRARRGYALFSPKDSLSLDRAGVRAEAGKDSGEIIA